MSGAIQRSARASSQGSLLVPMIDHAHAQVLGDVIDYLAVGVILTDAKGHPLWLNRSATEIIASNAGLSFTNGNLETVDSFATRQLQELLKRAVAHDESEPLATSIFAVLIPREDRQGSLSVVVAPVSRASSNDNKTDVAAIVFVSDPDAGMELPAGLLHRLFGLTRSESRVAVAMARGETLEGAAKASAIKISTARTHMKKIFAKTGRHGQTDLVRTLTRCFGFVRFD